MSYIPHSDEDIQLMLESIGLKHIEELFNDIPEHLKLKTNLNLPPPVNDYNLEALLKDKASKNKILPIQNRFVGAGAYQHYIPKVVDYFSFRGDFTTAYTPYQPELSQGTLQAIFEFQTLICQLTNMEVTNASLYDGATATAEAILMAHRITKNKTVFISKALHPHYRKVVETYIKHQDFNVIELPVKDGYTDLSPFINLEENKFASVVIQYPNFFGIIENLDYISNKIREKNGLFIVVVSELTSLGIIRPPGDFNADIVVGEAQSFGNPLNFGGPYVGFMSAKKKFVRQMPGRLVGMTKDTQGEIGFVLTLSTREQHIRRERATSNICTNQGLCALFTAIHLATLGKKGLQNLAVTNLQKAHYLFNNLKKLNNINLPYSEQPFYNEFIIEVDNVDKLIELFSNENMLPGLPLRNFSENLKNQILVCVTEVNTKKSIDKYIQLIKQL